MGAETAARKRSAFSTGRGYVAVAGAALLWASSGTVAKLLMAGGMSPYELVQARTTLSSLLLGALLLVVDRRLLAVRVRDIGYFAVLGGVVLALVQVTYFLAISHIQIAAAVLLQYTSPVLVAVYAMCFWREKLTAPKLLALLLALAGCYLVVEGYNLQLLTMNRAGVLAGLAACVTFAAYTLLGERGMHRYGPWTVACYALLFAAAAWNLMHRPLHFLYAGHSAREWAYLGYVVVLGTVIPFGLYFAGVSLIRSTRASITGTLEPVSAGLIAYLVLGETLRPAQLVGGGLVLAAIALLQLRRAADDLAPDAIRRQAADQTGGGRPGPGGSEAPPFSASG